MAAAGALDPETIARLRAWIADANASRDAAGAAGAAGAASALGVDTRLIDEGVLDSLQMVNFILFIEELSGRELPEALIQPERFVSLRVIHDTFFADPAGDPGPGRR